MQTCSYSYIKKCYKNSSTGLTVWVTSVVKGNICLSRKRHYGIICPHICSVFEFSRSVQVFLNLKGFASVFIQSKLFVDSRLALIASPSVGNKTAGASLWIWGSAAFITQPCVSFTQPDAPLFILLCCIKVCPFTRSCFFHSDKWSKINTTSAPNMLINSKHLRKKIKMTRTIVEK